MGWDRSRVLEAISLWQSVDPRAGLLGEPNPNLSGAVESLIVNPVQVAASTPQGRILRWAGECAASGEAIASVITMGREGEHAWESRRFLKAGIPVAPIEGLEQLLQPTRDRTYLAGREVDPLPELSEEEARLADAFFLPRPVPLESDVWEWMASLAGLDNGPSAMLAAKKLVIGRIWRRLAFRSGLLLFGTLRGSGLAEWLFEDESQLASAAEALANLACTGDVSIRTTGGGERGNLAALVLAAREAEGEAAVQFISQQWNRPFHRWTPLVIV
jgi:hypothetical protein